jgi:hypothetical protein
VLAHILDAFLSGDPSALWAAVGAVVSGGWDAVNEKWNDLVDDATGRKDVKEYLEDLFNDLLPDPEMWNHTREKLDELWENAKSEGEEVFQQIADTVQQALDTGEISQQGDGGLGATHDIWTPEADDVPQMPVGDLPGIGDAEAGMPRDGGGDYGSSPGGYSGGSSSSPTPIGDTPSGPSAPSGPPTASDLGVPEGSYIEYQPGAHQVVITYPDGTTEVRPWN